MDFFIRTTDLIKREARTEAVLRNDFFTKRLAQIGNAKSLERRIFASRNLTPLLTAGAVDQEIVI